MKRLKLRNTSFTGTLGIKTLCLTLSAVVVAAFCSSAEIYWAWKTIPVVVFWWCMGKEL